MAATPQPANKTLKRLSQMMDLVVKLQWRTDKAVDKFSSATEGFHSWDEGEIARFYEIHPLGSPAHICITLMLHTGAAKVDVVKLGPANVKNGRIEYRRQKTQKNPSGILVSLPIHPALATALAARPVTFTYLETGHRIKLGPATVWERRCASGVMPLARRCVHHMDCAKPYVGGLLRLGEHPTKSWPSVVM